MTRRKEYEFVVTLKHPEYKIYDIVSALMCVMAIAASIFGMLHSPFISRDWWNIGLIGFIFVYMLIPFLSKKKADYILAFKWALFACGLLWLFFPLQTISIAVFYVIAALLERQIKFPQEIGFDDHGATVNTFPFKSYSWHDIVNVVLKDNILTIDFKNNRILQKQTETDTAIETEKEFNEFCGRHLAHAVQS